MLSLQVFLIYGLLGLSTLVNIVVPFSGSATITPLLAMLVDPHRAIGIATFYFFLTAPPRIFFFWENIQWQEIKTLLLPSVIAAFFGALALVIIPVRWLLVTILLFSIYFLLKKLQIIPKAKWSHRYLDHFVGLFSGFLQGTGLAGSDLRNQYLYAQDLKIAEVHGTTAVIGGANFLVATIVRLNTGQLALPDITPLLYFFPVMVLATWLGKKALFKLPKKVSDALVIGIMIAVIFSFAYAVFFK
ncbi:MAG: sulfite exporter TauE/SafE family protein [Candidatus Pacebacteria bacterium]|nr:sulfite exporter TauE/SafE family protein [Candidatus Paceibacterota bacterium]